MTGSQWWLPLLGLGRSEDNWWQRIIAAQIGDTAEDDEDEDGEDKLSGLLTQYKQKLSEPAAQPDAEYMKRARLGSLGSALAAFGAGATRGDWGGGAYAGAREFRSGMDEALEKWQRQQKEAQARELERFQLDMDIQKAKEAERKLDEEKEAEKQRKEAESRFLAQADPELRSLYISADPRARLAIQQQWLSQQMKEREPEKPERLVPKDSIDPKTGKVVTQWRNPYTGEVVKTTESAGLSTSAFSAANRRETERSTPEWKLKQAERVAKHGYLVEAGVLEYDDLRAYDSALPAARREVSEIVAQNRSREKGPSPAPFLLPEQIAVDGVHVQKEGNRYIINGQEYMIQDTPRGKRVYLDAEAQVAVANALAVRRTNTEVNTARRTPQAGGIDDPAKGERGLSGTTPPPRVTVVGKPGPPGGEQGKQPTPQEAQALKAELEQIELAEGGWDPEERRRKLLEAASAQGFNYTFLLKLIGW